MPKKRIVYKLNLGCGSNKLEGYINIDTEKSTKPDLVHDFVKCSLPYKPNTIDEIVLFHTIEHIRKEFHPQLIAEFFRVMKVARPLFISYPNFWECASRWKDNYQGKRDFWHKTMFGRQLYPADYHVCAMDPKELEVLLLKVGFEHVHHKQEKHEPYNTITTAIRGKHANTRNYEDEVRDSMVKMRVGKL